MPDLSLHLAPHTQWLVLVPASLALLALAIWAYRFAFPPLPALSRRGLPALRAAVLLGLAWLLAQPVLERALPASGRRVTVLVDHSRSMDLPAGEGALTRAEQAAAAARAITSALAGRASVSTRGFAGALEPDTARAQAGSRDATALGDALAALADLPAERRPDGVVVVSDGAVNAGADPVAAARALGVPVHTVVVGAPLGADRAIAEVEGSAQARVGEATPVRVHVRSSEPRGVPIGVQLLDQGRELARASVASPGPGAEAVAELKVTPTKPGLAVWTARVDSLRGDAVPTNDAREVAVPVAPGKLGVLIVSAGLNWDLAFLRRALLGDSSVTLGTRVRQRGGAWQAVETGRGATPVPADLHGQAVVVLDGLSSAEVSPAFDQALASFVRDGGGLLLLPGAAPGLARFEHGALARELAVQRAPGAERTASPQVTPAAAELLAWDDDPARGEQAWRTAAPLSSVQPLAAGGGDRVLIGASGGGPALLFSRRVGRGPVLMLNGEGLWRWSLSGTDDLAGDRGRRLWRRVIRWLSEPVQGEPLRVQPERWLSASGEPVRLLASLQDAEFRPLAGATLTGSASDGHGHTLALAFAPRGSGSYETRLASPPPGRWQVDVRASHGGRELGHAHSEFAVDRWSLEALASEPDSAAMAAIAAASGGRASRARDAQGWAHALTTRELTRRRTSSTRLWESPWLFGALVAMLSTEWITRRRRGLP